ncbi:hypothetical protein TNCT_501521 [Trichonephila clavata]|uniref:Uncharacterized protein n=1 Tax=Trichonephila clavata TaxID=2740835 RepID=A0A8X6HWP1_TRICU|nr:hypothetical protein TNCT_501521 [Trichonephila clavata]
MMPLELISGPGAGITLPNSGSKIYYQKLGYIRLGTLGLCLKRNGWQALAQVQIASLYWLLSLNYTSYEELHLQLLTGD